MAIVSTVRLVALPTPMCVEYVIALPNGRVIAAQDRTDDDPRYTEDTCDLIVLEPNASDWRPLCSAPQRVGGMIALGDDRILVVDHSAQRSSVLDLATNQWHARKMHGLGAQRSFTLMLVGSGSVLLAAGTIEDQPIKNCALYDIAGQKWSSTGSMRRGFGGIHDDSLANAVRLSTNELLFVGGRHAELYDAQSGRWTMTGRVDGRRSAPIGQRCALTYSGELYDAATGRWTIVEGGFRSGGPMVVQRDGRVFAFSRDGIESVDPKTRSWAPVADLPAEVSWRYEATRVDEQSVLLWATEAAVAHMVLWSWKDNTPPPPQTEIEAFIGGLQTAVSSDQRGTLATTLYDVVVDVIEPRARATVISDTLADLGVPMRAHAIWRQIRDWPRQLKAPANHKEETMIEPIKKTQAAMTFVVGDATRPQGPAPHIIAHICNDRGGWGRGFVTAVTRMSPAPEKAYRAWYSSRQANDFALGALQVVSVTDTLSVANMVAQKGYRAQNGQPPIRYEALAQALTALAAHALEHGAGVHMPRIGCGLAGGEWSAVQSVIEETLLAQGVSVTVYDLPS